ncbi:MAG TPA: hypothetical protein VN829_13575 [Dongiaceae bacterium]|nr:hypothetical protein [Dongiaceae bacterium]
MNNSLMKAAQVMEQVRKLPPEEVFRLGQMIEELEEQLWDQEIERDARPGGPLDKLAQEAIRESEAGKAVPLDDFLGHS